MNENSSANNALKLIVFRINEDQPYYGINVFKTFEIQRAKHFTISEIPRANEYIEGIVYIRNQPVPLVNLPHWLRTDLSEQEERNSSIIFCNDVSHPTRLTKAAARATIRNLPRVLIRLSLSKLERQLRAGSCASLFARNLDVCRSHGVGHSVVVLRSQWSEWQA